MAFTFFVNGVEQTLQPGFSIRESTNGRNLFNGTMLSLDGSFRLEVGDTIGLIEDGLVIFGGTIDQPAEAGFGGVSATDAITLRVSAVDYNEIADRRQVVLDIVAGNVKAALIALEPYYDDYGVTLWVSQADGPSLPALSFDGERLREVLDQISALTDHAWAWKIDYEKRLSVEEIADTPAPFDVEDVDVADYVDGDITVEQPTASSYGNYIYVLAGEGQRNIDFERHDGDGVTRSFVLDVTAVALIGALRIDGGGGGYLVGVYGVDVMEWTFDASTNAIIQDPAYTVIASGHYIEMSYVAQYPVEVFADGGAAPADRVDKTYSEPKVFDKLVAQGLANAYLARDMRRPRTVRYNTFEAAIHPGMTQLFDIAKRNLSGQFVITDVEIVNTAGIRVMRSVTAVEGEILPASIGATVMGWGRSSTGASSGGVVTVVSAGGVGGSGTPGSLAKWATSSTLTDIGASATIAAAITFTSAPFISTTEPALYFCETDQGSNLKNIRFDLQGGVLQVQTLTDAFSVSATILTLSRAGALAVSAGITAGSGTVGIVDSTGKIPAVSATYFASLVSTLTGVGALNSGSITSGFGSIDVGADAISGGAISGTTLAISTTSTFGANLAIGVANVNSLLFIGATLTGNTGNGTGLNVSPVLSPVANFLGRGAVIAPTINEAASGTHVLLSGLTLSNANAIVAGGAAVTNTAMLYIDGPWAATVTGANYALWVDSGTTRLDGPVTALDTLAVTGVATFTTHILPGVNYTSNLGATATKFLQAHIAELVVETLVAQNTTATIGGRVLVAPTNILTADLAAAGTLITLKYNNFTNGDRIRLEAEGKVEWMAIASVAGGSAGAYTYTVTRNLDGSGADQWYAGDAALDTGTTGNGFIDLYSTAGVLSGTGPTIVGNVRTGTTYNNIAARWAIGNLDGLYGYSGSAYGAAFGDASAINITIDATNGFRIRNSTTNKFTADTSGNLSIVGDLAVGTAGVIRSNATAFGTGTGYWLDYNAGTPRFRVGTVSGNRLSWDGTVLEIVSTNFTANSSGVTIAPAATGIFGATNAYRFTRPTGDGYGASGDIWGVWGSHSSDLQYLVIENTVVGTTADGMAHVKLICTGWDGGGSPVAFAAALVELESSVTRPGRVTVTGPESVRMVGPTLTSTTFQTGTAADATAYTQSNANLMAGNNGEALGVAGSTSLSNINFYIHGAAQRKATIQVVGGVGASSRGGRLLFFTKDDAAVGTDVVQAGYFDFSTGGAGGGFVVGVPTGGSKGAGTINAVAVYDDNVLLTDWVFDLHFAGVTMNARAGRLYSISDVYVSAKHERRLPWMPTEFDFESQRSTGGMITRLWQGQEQQQIYAFNHEARITELETELKHLKESRA